MKCAARQHRIGKAFNRFGTFCQRRMDGFSGNLAVFHRSDCQILTTGNAIAARPNAFNGGAAFVIDADTSLGKPDAGTCQRFWNEGLAPVWWMRFRVLLSIVVLASLGAAL